jgi:hypothetical protein
LSPIAERSSIFALPIFSIDNAHFSKNNELLKPHKKLFKNVLNLTHYCLDGLLRLIKKSHFFKPQKKNEITSLGGDKLRAFDFSSPIQNLPAGLNVWRASRHKVKNFCYCCSRHHRVFCGFADRLEKGVAPAVGAPPSNQEEINEEQPKI